jgi:hypothetical protein
MKRILLAATIMTAVAGGGWVAAQTVPAPKAGAGTPARPQRGGGMGYGMGPGMMGGGMGPGMMGGGMMGMGGGMCSMMMGDASLKLDVKKIDKGVTITMTSTDAATAARLQKMAEAMRLMHEAMTE